MIGSLAYALRGSRHSLIVLRGDSTTAFDGNGVTDLYRLATAGSDALRGAAVADKIIGRAAMALLLLCGAKEIYGEVMSSLALSLPRDNNVTVTYGTLVHHIRARHGDGWCPLEERLAHCLTPEDCYAQIAAFMEHNGR